MTLRNIIKANIGDEFGRWTVIDIIKKEQTYCLCRCVCGLEKEVSQYALTRGGSKGCITCAAQGRNTTHGMRHTRIYTIWQRMMSRCYYEKNNRYYCYGGRGIKVCEDWHDAETFMKWGIENGYKENLTIDRIDTNGNYEPTNCRWVTPAQNSRNKNKKSTPSKSKYKGVTWHKHSHKWVARITLDGKLISLGYFDSEHDAAIAYNERAKELHGEFALLNQIEDDSSATP